MMLVIEMKKLIISIIIILVILSIYFIINKTFSKTLVKKEYSNKKRTILKLINNIFKYVLLVIAILFLLQINGINVTSIIAGLGIVSLVAGLALQDALKDIIMGFNLIFDNYFSVGDVIQINDITGKVLELGIKATKIKDIYTSNVLTIANRNIAQALVLSEQFEINLPLPYEENIANIEKVIKKIIEKSTKIPNIKNIEYKGLQSFESSAINYRIRFYCKPEYYEDVLREINKIIKTTIDSEKISIPYTQIRLK